MQLKPNQGKKMSYEDVEVEDTKQVEKKSIYRLCDLMQALTNANNEITRLQEEKKRLEALIKEVEKVAKTAELSEI